MLRKSLSVFALFGLFITAGLVASDIYVKVSPEDVRQVTIVDTEKGVKEIYFLKEGYVLDERFSTLKDMDPEDAKVVMKEIAEDIRKEHGNPFKSTNIDSSEISKVKSEAQGFWRGCGWRRWYNPCCWSWGWSAVYTYGFGYWGWGFCW